MVLFSTLSWKAQLNCICDHTAKVWTSADGMEATRSCRLFPLEPVGVFVGGQKMTSDMGNHICFWAQHRLAHNNYQNYNIYLWSSLAMWTGGQFTPPYTAYLDCSNYRPQNHAGGCRKNEISLIPRQQKSDMPELSSI